MVDDYVDTESKFCRLLTDFKGTIRQNKIKYSVVFTQPKAVWSYAGTQISNFAIEYLHKNKKVHKKVSACSFDTVRECSFDTSAASLN